MLSNLFSNISVNGTSFFTAIVSGTKFFVIQESISEK